jgi:hypothetical protein
MKEFPPNCPICGDIYSNEFIYIYSYKICSSHLDHSCAISYDNLDNILEIKYRFNNLSLIWELNNSNDFYVYRYDKIIHLPWIEPILYNFDKKTFLNKINKYIIFS